MKEREGAPFLNGSEIAVIGMACRFPGARNLDEYWEVLRNGIETTSFLSDEDLEPSGVEAAIQSHPNYVKAAAVLDDIELFDASFFGYAPKEAEIMDPQQRLFLEAAWEALEHSGHNPATYQGAIGVFAGARTNTYLYNLVSNPEALESLGAFEIGLGNDLAFLSARVSHKLGLRGPAYSIHTACSTGLVAVHLACQSLLVDECQMALAGGIAINVPQKTGYLYREGGILSPDGRCRAFDARAAGTLFGSGVGVVVLKRLEQALADGDQIFAVLKGSATNNDGASKASFTAPSVEGQARVVAEALAVAGVASETVTYVEAHGTGTRLGDPIEVRALTKAFRAVTDKKGFCAIGSVKTNFGHLDAAAGIASFIKTVLALHHRMLPPSLHFEQPNPGIDFADSPFYVNTSLAEWESPASPRRAGVSSFGIGGTNAHVVLEEAQPAESSGGSRSHQLLLLSARTRNALDAMMANLGDHLRQHPEISLPDAAHTLHRGRAVFAHRAILVCRDVSEAVKALEIPEPPHVFTGLAETTERPVVFMFPGQGAQHLEMGNELYRSEPMFCRCVDDCSEILKRHLGFDLRTVLYPGEGRSEEAGRLLNETLVTQPALFVIEYALARLWMELGVHPTGMIGHSIGEYVAACLAHVLSLEDALELVTDRGRMMQELPGGDMLAIPLPEAEVLPLLSADLSLAAVNAKSQCVVSGPAVAVKELEDRLSLRGIRSRRLLTSHAFHSHLMEPIVGPFAQRVKRVTRFSPQIPYVSNVTGTWITDAEVQDPDYWARQLRSPVQFDRGLRSVCDPPSPILLEVGPGVTLGRLAAQSLTGDERPPVLASLPHPDDHQSEVAFFLTSLGRLWLGGVSLDGSGLFGQERRAKVSLPSYPFERQRYWVEPNRAQSDVRRRPVSSKQPDLGDWFYIPSWKRSMPPQPNDHQDANRTWVLFADKENALGPSIEKRLKQASQHVVVIQAAHKFERIDENAYSINPCASDDYDAIIRALREQGRDPDRIIHLLSVMPRRLGSSQTLFEEAQERGYYSLLYLMWALAKTKRDNPVHVEVVSDSMQEVGGEVSFPEKSTLLGPCIVASQEHPDVVCRSVDVDLADLGNGLESSDLADLLIAELQNPSPDKIIAYRGGKRWVRHYEPHVLNGSENSIRRLRQNGVYLITGGLGGVGLIVAEYLARTLKARLILTGRSKLPPREAWSALAADRIESEDEDKIARKIRRLRHIEELGGEVLVETADVADEVQMESLISRVYERYGRLNGVFHAAGITSGSSVYRALTEVGRDESEAQFIPKVRGLCVLERVLRDRSVDFCLLFSSNASVLGGLGFVAYAAANLFMDAFACARARDRSTAWISANWDHWPEETRQYTGISTSVDQFTMTVQESEEALRRVVCMAPPGQIVVSTGDLSNRLRVWVQGDGKAVAVGHAGAYPRPGLQTQFIAPSNETERVIADIWRQVLGIEHVGVLDNFFDLGGHSLLVTQVVGRVRDAFEIDLPLSKLFDVPTVAGLAEFIVNTRANEEDQTKRAILEMLSRLSEDEAEEELRKRRERQW